MTASSTASFRSAFAIVANSPRVNPWRTGMLKHPTKLDNADYGPSMDARDGVGPVEHIEGKACLGSRLQRVQQRTGIGVEARADILNIERQHIDIAQHFWRHAIAALRVEAPHRQTRRGVLRIGDILPILLASYSVLGSKNRGQPDLGVAHHINVAVARLIKPCVIGDQAHSLA